MHLSEAENGPSLLLSKEGEGFSRRTGEQRRNEKKRGWPALASLEEGRMAIPCPSRRKRGWPSLASLEPRERMAGRCLSLNK